MFVLAPSECNILNTMRCLLRGRSSFILPLVFSVINDFLTIIINSKSSSLTYVMMIALMVVLIAFNAIDFSNNKNVLALDNNEYNIMLKEIKGNFNVPVSERTKVERTTCRNNYRWMKEGKTLTIGNTGLSIYIDGKRLLRKDEMRLVVKKAIKDGKTLDVGKLLVDYMNVYLVVLTKM